MDSFVVSCPYCNEPVISNDEKYGLCHNCLFTFEIEGMTPYQTRDLFKYKNGSLIQFFKCCKCGEIITGCLHHRMEKCCDNFIDQEQDYCRISGSFINVTNDISYEEKRRIFTKTVFNSNAHDEEWIINELNAPQFSNEIFSKQEYMRLYNLWKEDNNNEISP